MGWRLTLVTHLILIVWLVYSGNLTRDVKYVSKVFAWTDSTGGHCLGLEEATFLHPLSLSALLHAHHLET